jgi:Glycosyltransferase family 87
MSAKLRIAGTALLLAATLAALAGLILLIARPHLTSAGTHPLKLVAGAWLVFACAAWLVRGAPVRLAVGLILVGGIALQVVALAGPPQNSSDLYRYIWDGRVQVAGIDPYLYAPSDAGVAQLRDPFLWTGTGAGHYGDCVKSKPSAADPSDGLVAGCTKLNRPKVPTVYPPVAEAYFTAIQLAAPADDSTTPVQAAAAGFAVLITVMLLFGLWKLGRDPRLAALWAWCPTVLLEAGQNGHVDVVGVALALAALLLLARAKTKGRVITGGVLLGLAIATKVTPALVMPAVLRRGWVLISASVLTAVSLVYVPHVVAVGQKIIGFFPGYLKQEGYSTGTGYSVIELFVQGKEATLVAAVILGAIALAIYRYCDPDNPWRGGVLMTSAALAVCTPHFQWYAILLVMLVALDGQPEWLAIAAGGYLSNTPGLRIGGVMLHDPRLLGYGGGAAIACTLALTRFLVTRRSRAAQPEPASVSVAVSSAAADNITLPSDSVSGPVLEPTAIFARPVKSPQGTPADVGAR